MQALSFPNATTDELEQALAAAEEVVAQQRALQVRLLADLDARQVNLTDGSRSMAEWVAARLDVSPETATDLMRLSRRLADEPLAAEGLATGRCTFDRVVEESRLAAAGAPRQIIEASRGWDLTGVRRLAARHRRMTRRDECEVFEGRFVALQPALDESVWRLWGRLPGFEGRIVEEAISRRADHFPRLPDGSRGSRAQRQADALVSIANDALDGGRLEDPGAAEPLVSIFVDARIAAESNGQAGASIPSGPRVGPLTLEQILCGGRVEVLASGIDGRPITVGPAARVISPKLRRWILHRDGGCSADGCRSRYRLQPHHIDPRSAGGNHEPDNLVTLCWFHHHVVIHRQGFRIDPDSPPHRRRFLSPIGDRAPP